MFSANQVPDADRMRPRRATNPARTDERQLTRQGQKKRFGTSASPSGAGANEVGLRRRHLPMRNECPTSAYRHSLSLPCNPKQIGAEMTEARKVEFPGATGAMLAARLDLPT